MTRIFPAAVTMLVVSSFLLAGMAVMANGGSNDTSLLPTFSNDLQLQMYLKRGAYYSNQFYNESKDLSPVPVSADMSESGSRYSTTNVQVFGVDEMDTVKTDGEFLYLASSDAVSIVRAYPSNGLANVSMINATTLNAEGSLYFCGIFLYGDKLVVVYNIWKNNVYSMPYFVPSQQRTMVSVFDVSDASSPKLVSSCGVSGFLVAARMIEDRVYLISQDYVLWVSQNVALPETYNNSSAVSVAATDVKYDPSCQDPSSFVNLFSLNITSKETNCQTIVAGYSSVIYVSQSSIFLTFQNGYGNVVPVMTMLVDYQPVITTTIFKFDIDGLNLTCSAKGEVEGWLLNQFSMDESGGYLRVATTTSWTSPLNDVFVLNEKLEIIGSILGMAPNERIYSARFLGDMLYLVTFRQIDPLFAVDLSDAHHPKVIGELKIPGVSTYLHPYGVDRLIGIGFMNGSVKISLFDVSDPTDPSEVMSYAIEGYSYSLAQYDHHAVLFDEATGLLVIPVVVYQPMYYYGTMSEAFVFTLTTNGISLRGTVSQGNATYGWYNNYIQRSLFIDDYLYTVSDEVVKVSSLSDLSDVATLIYHLPNYYWAYPGAVK